MTLNVGIALTPANVNNARHTQLVYGAFEAFTVSVMNQAVGARQIAQT